MGVRQHVGAAPVGGSSSHCWSLASTSGASEALPRGAGSSACGAGAGAGAAAADAGAASCKRDRPACWYFEQGMCTKGSMCPFKHDGGMEAFQANMFAAARIEALTPPCWYYERGCCQKGSSCPFKHDGTRPQGVLTSKKLKLEMDADPDDTIWTAVKVALESVNHCESDEEIRKLRTKISQYARSAAQGIDLQKRPVNAPIDEYADNLFNKIFQVLGDRPWLAQADLLLVLDAAVKELLPMESLLEVPPEELESMIFSAHDRAVDEQRSMPLVWDAVTLMLQGPKTRSKAYKALDAGRKGTAADPEVAAEGSAELFASRWIAATAEQLHALSGGYAEHVLPADTATGLFVSLVEAGALPSRCMAECTEPEGGWQTFITAAVRKAYAGPQAPAKEKHPEHAESRPVRPLRPREGERKQGWRVASAAPRRQAGRAG